MKNTKHQPKTCNETMLRDKMRVFVSRIWPPRVLVSKVMTVFIRVDISITWSVQYTDINSINPSKRNICKKNLFFSTTIVVYLTYALLWPLKFCVKFFRPRIALKFRISKFQTKPFLTVFHFFRKDPFARNTCLYFLMYTFCGLVNDRKSLL